ncbi:MAG: hypothetical protein AAF651_07930, partial [Cyanobacteria bacterium P01_C01_bin.73]
MALAPCRAIATAWVGSISPQIFTQSAEFVRAIVKGLTLLNMLLEVCHLKKYAGFYAVAWAVPWQTY